MFWFWFWSVVHILMIASDVAWWIVAMRLAKRSLWRVLASVFIAGQTAALLLLIGGFDWTTQAPKAVHLAVATWHYFVLGLGFVVLLWLGIARACAWMRRRITRATGPRPNRPLAAPASANPRSRREFIGACAALAPPLLTVGFTGMALAQLKHLRVRRFTLSIPALPRALDGITIAHVSDMHVGGLTASRTLREMVNTANALRPDLVLMTGDLIDYRLGGPLRGNCPGQSAGRALRPVDGRRQP